MENMAAPNNQLTGDAIDAIRPDLEAFASLWSALRTNYQGTNITKTVARLLHMYQPEDGVLAYERLLRTLYVLLEDFDGDGLRLLVSMVPPPKGVADEIIKEVFHKATGFVRLNAPIFHRNATNSESDPSLNEKIADMKSGSRTPITNAGTPRLQTVFSSAENVPEGSTILRAIVKSEAASKFSNKSPKVRTRDSEVFRGFPSNEITNTQSHARNMTHFYGPSMNYSGFSNNNQRYVDYRDIQPQNSSNLNPPRGLDSSSAYRLTKWIEQPMLIRKNNYDGQTIATNNYPDLILKTADNKFIRLPITKVNGPPIASYNTSYNNPIQTYQAFYPNGQLHPRNEDCNLDSSSANIPRKASNYFNTNKVFDENQKPDDSNESKEKRLRNSRIDLVDHDYIFTRPENFTADKENFEIDNSGSPNNEMIEKFRDTVKNSQRAIQEDIYRMDVVRCDDEIHSIAAEDINYPNLESLTATKGLKKSISDFLKRAEEEKSIKSPAFPKTRMLQDPENYPPMLVKSSPKNWKPRKKSTINSETIKTFGVTSKNYSPSIAAKSSRGKIDKNQLKSERTSQKITNSNRNFAERSSIASNENNSNSSRNVEFTRNPNENFRQPNSMAELVNYRKQYYDALLSIQRAKVAVANSLAISSSQNSTGCDPRVLQYLHQQHQMLQQQQQRLLMSSQHQTIARQAILQPGFANIRGAPGLWIRGSNEWKYSPCGQYAFPRQTYPITSTTSTRSAEDPINTASNSSISEMFSQAPQQQQHKHKNSRAPAKRRKLEDIVGKLKDDNN